MQKLNVVETLEEPVLEQQLECFKYNNPELYRESLLFINKLRAYFNTFSNVTISLEKGMTNLQEICLKMQLFNLPVFFRIHQNSLVTVMTSIEMCNYVPDESWFKFNGCYIKSTSVNDPKLFDVFLDITNIMEGFCQKLMQEVARQRKQILSLQSHSNNHKSHNLIWQAPLISSLVTILLVDDSSDIGLTNINFLLDLIINTGLALSFLIGMESFIKKIQYERQD